jgi:hypothetical protein
MKIGSAVVLTAVIITLFAGIFFYWNSIRHSPAWINENEDTSLNAFFVILPFGFLAIIISERVELTEPIRDILKVTVLLQ